MFSPRHLRNAIAPALLLLGTAAVPSVARADAKPATPSPAAASARADIGKTLGFVPQFFNDIPDSVLPGTWDEMKALQLNPSTALPGKVKELIGLAVAAQIPCRYCIVAHTDFAKLGGATTAEVGEAIGMAAITRHWSTFLNGVSTDETRFRAEIGQLIHNAKQAGKRPPAGAPIKVTDGASALADISQSLGLQPEFLKRFPSNGRAGAWRTMKELQMNPGTSLSGKHKELVGLAVAAQVPCKYCVIAHTEFARLNGATDAEITEAVAMAAFTRHMSTLLNGVQVDEGQFRRDVDKLVRGAQAAAKRATRARSETAAAR
jgi:AhpD family alkylhydroperoxidase